MTYCDFKPGDEVVYVGRVVSSPDDLADIRPDSGLLEKGRVYVVEHVFVDPFWGDVGITVVGVRSDHHTGGFSVYAFRKVQRRKTDLSIEAFLTIKPGFEEPRRVPKKERVS